MAIEKIKKIIETISSILLAMLTTTVFIGVMSRYLFKKPIISSSALTMLIFPWMVFLTAILVAANNDNISIEYFRKLLPRKVQIILINTIHIASLIFMIYFFKSSIDYVKAGTFQRAPILMIYKSWFYLSLPIAFGGMIFFKLYDIYMQILAIGKRKWSKKVIIK